MKSFQSTNKKKVSNIINGYNKLSKLNVSVFNVNGLIISFYIALFHTDRY